MVFGESCAVSSRFTTSKVSFVCDQVVRHASTKAPLSPKLFAIVWGPRPMRNPSGVERGVTGSSMVSPSRISWKRRVWPFEP